MLSYFPWPKHDLSFAEQKDWHGFLAHCASTCAQLFTRSRHFEPCCHSYTQEVRICTETKKSPMRFYLSPSQFNMASIFRRVWPVGCSFRIGRLCIAPTLKPFISLRLRSYCVDPFSARLISSLLDSREGTICARDCHRKISLSAAHLWRYWNAKEAPPKECSWRIPSKETRASLLTLRCKKTNILDFYGECMQIS